MPWRRRNTELSRFLIMIMPILYLNNVCYIQMFERLIICFTYVENCSFLPQVSGSECHILSA